MEKPVNNKTNLVVADCVKAVEFAMFMSSLMFGHKIQREKSCQKERKK